MEGLSNFGNYKIYTYDGSEFNWFTGDEMGICRLNFNNITGFVGFEIYDNSSDAYKFEITNAS